MNVNIHMTTTEFGKLKKVVVGDAKNAKIPSYDISFHTVCHADKPPRWRSQSHSYPEQVIEEAQEDLEKVVDALKGFGVEVLSPSFSRMPDCYYYCPRDIVLSYKDMLIAAPTPIRARQWEYTNLFDNEEIIRGKKCINLTSSFEDNMYNQNCLGNKDVLALNDHMPAFEAANILKHHEQIFYLVSNSANEKGAELLQEILGSKVKINLIKGVYSFMHIDSTIAILRDGLLLVNPARIKSKAQLPEYFKSWDIIFAPEPTDIGYFDHYCNASQWVNINLLSLDENTVLLEGRQKDLIDLLKKYNIESLPVNIRHARTLGGGPHCVTLDLDRE